MSNYLITILVFLSVTMFRRDMLIVKILTGFVMR